MKELELTQEDLAQPLGVTRAAVTHYLRGKRAPTPEQMTTLAHELRCSIDWLMTGEGTVTRYIRVLSYENAIDPEKALAQPSSGDPDSVIPIPLWDDPELGLVFALNVEGRGLEPELREDDLVVVATNATPKTGALVVVKRMGEARVRLGLYSELEIEKKKFELTTNIRQPPIPIDSSSGHIVGTVIEQRRSLVRYLNSQWGVKE